MPWKQCVLRRGHADAGVCGLSERDAGSLGWPVRGGSNRYTPGNYMARAELLLGFQDCARAGTVSVMDQGNGGTVAGNVAAINRQTAALQDLRQARRRSQCRSASASARTGYVVASIPRCRERANRCVRDLLPDMSRASAGQQLQLADIAQRGQCLAVAGFFGPVGQQLRANTARANTLADLFKQQQQFGLEQQRLGVDQQKINADAALPHERSATEVGAERSRTPS